jgi:predicted dehydrogenase
MARPMKVGVIGVGLHGMHHVRAYAALPSVKLTAVADVKAERAGEVAQEFNIPHWYAGYQEMLAGVDLDIVSIATPDHLHLEPTLAALNAGVNVLLEKPMALTVADAERMVRAAESSHVKLMVNFAPRWQLPNAQAKDALDRGELGYPIYAYVRMVNTLYVPTKMLAWTSQTALPHWLLTHASDRVRWFFGSEPKRVYAVSTSGVLKEMGLDVDDLYHATVEFENGAIATLETFWILPESVPLIGSSVFELICSKGYVVVDATAPLTTIATPGKYMHPGPFAGVLHGEPVGMVNEAVKHFVKCVIDGREPLITARDGLAVTRLVCAIVESAQRRDFVTLD